MKQGSQLSSEELTELQKKVEKMANEFKEKKESGQIKDDKKQVTVMGIVSGGTSGCEMCWWYVGIIGAFLSGMASPLGYVVFGALVDDVGS